MAKDPGQRYQSAAEMRTDIQRALNGVPVAAPRAAAYGAGAYGTTQRLAGGPPTAGPTRAIPGYEYGPPADRYDRRGGGPRRRTWILWLIGVVLVLAALGGVAYAFFGSHGPSTAVPQVDGVAQAQAVRLVQQAGLVPKVVQQASSTVNKGLVITTSPPNGQKVNPNTTVTLYVSSGQAKIKVPNVVGQQQAQAQAALSQFNVVPKTDPASTKPNGTVVSQNPPAGTLLLPGSTVTIYVSGGGAQVPTVTNYPWATAQQMLQNAGFVVKVVTSAGPPGSLPGIVYSQSPAGGTTQPTGSTVTIYVQPTASPTISPTPTATATPSPKPA
jgi:serine/threonine-protein kinase